MSLEIHRTNITRLWSNVSLLEKEYDKAFSAWLWIKKKHLVNIEWNNINTVTY